VPYLEKLKGKEVFVVGQDESTITPGELSLFEKYEDLWAHISQMELSIDNDARVIHGVLFPATFLPSTFRGTTPFLVMCDTLESMEEEPVGVIVEVPAATVEELAEFIENILNAAVPDINTTIDDIYVVYGYEPRLSITLDPEEIDEGAISEGKALVAEADVLEDAFYTEQIMTGLDQVFPT
jgi:hypothetical protein